MDFICLIGIFSFWNLAVLALYGIDKLKAKRSVRRISENFLIAIALLMGGVGAILGMVIFHHKVSKAKFRVLVPLSLIMTLAGLVYGVCLLCG